MNIYWNKSQIPQLKGLSAVERQELLKPILRKAWGHWQVLGAFAAQMVFIFWFIYFGPVFSHKFWVVVILAFSTGIVASLPLNHFLGHYLASEDYRPPPKHDSVPLFQGAWLSLIEAELGPTCDVVLSKIGSVSIERNGARSEQWFVRTSLGNFEYRVDYYPSNAYPERARPFEIAKVAGSITRSSD